MSRKQEKLPLVIYDTSSILAIFKEKVDTLRQVYLTVGPHIPIILPNTIRELKELSTKRERATSRAAELSLRLIINKFSIISYDENKPTDEAILDIARRLSERGYNIIVVTCDLELRKRLESAGVRVMYLRKSRFFTFEE